MRIKMQIAGVAQRKLHRFSNGRNRDSVKTIWRLHLKVMSSEPRYRAGYGLWSFKYKPCSVQ